MRIGERFAEPRAAELVSHHRFARIVGFARSRGEARTAAHRLEKQENHPRGGILGEQLDQLTGADVGLVADRDELGEAQAPRRAARKHAAEHGSALRNEARRSGRQRVHLENRVHAERHAPLNVDEPHAVGPEHAHAELARTRDQPRLPLCTFRPGVGKAVAENRRHPHAASAALLECALHRIAWRHDEGVVDRFRRLGKTAPGTLAQHFAARSVDRHDAAGVAVLAQVAQGARSVFCSVAGCADQRDRAGRKKRPR